MTTEARDSAEDAAYRAKARAWLAENAAEYKTAGPISEDDMPARSQAWTRKKWDNGYSGIEVPDSAGGAGGTRRQAQIFAEEERAYNVPRGTAHGLAIAAYMKYGTPEQIKRWGTVMWSGAGNWTQLFSEPAAGSDLAALRTRAVRQGDKWIVNGQKVWSSFAHHADYGFMIARTDGSVPKHKGLSFFFINMRQPGITVRPIQQMTGAADFNEVFFVDAVVPDADRIGAEGEGWAVAMTVLGAERTGAGTAGAGGAVESPVSTANLLRVARNAQRENGVALDSAAVRAQIAQFYVEEQGVKNFGLRMQEQMAAGGPPPASMPVMKLTSASRNQQAFAFLQDMEEAGGVVEDANWPADKDKYYDYLYSPIWRIAGGSDQVLRNQLSERALGMPGDMRIDKDVPFDKLPV
jgi:alkylation response protein AidB-like acyl-CoA dehydrogenase